MDGGWFMVSMIDEQYFMFDIQNSNWIHDEFIGFIKHEIQFRIGLSGKPNNINNNNYETNQENVGTEKM